MTNQITPWNLLQYFHSALTAIATVRIDKVQWKFRNIFIHDMLSLLEKPRHREKGSEIHILIHRAYRNCTDRFQEWFSHTKTRTNFISIYIREYFQGTTPRSPDFRPLYFCLWRHLKTPYFIQVHFKMQRHFTNALLRRVELFPTASGPVKFATVHEHTYQCANWFKWRACGTFVVNCDFIKHKNSTVINP